MMAITLLAFAALALLGVLAGEIGDLTFARRKADAGRSRTLGAPERARLRW
jgi:hypothetical protein